MAFTVYQTNKKTGAVYAYSQEAYRDPVTKKPKSRRTYLGRVDPVTKKIIPRGEGGVRCQKKDPFLSKDNPDDLNELTSRIQELTDLLYAQQARIDELSAQYNHMAESLRSISRIIDEATH